MDEVLGTGVRELFNRALGEKYSAVSVREDADAHGRSEYPEDVSYGNRQHSHWLGQSDSPPPLQENQDPGSTRA